MRLVASACTKMKKYRALHKPHTTANRGVAVEQNSSPLDVGVASDLAASALPVRPPISDLARFSVFFGLVWCPLVLKF